ncbi:diacylglycerol O-acyltransferase 2 isoform X1 [Salmo salar]|uniref:Acyltransferase n=1 Tax=Salmo salar TaxID=8030 RepID=A0A1S3NSQ2_SALSA|nr:diacylglycerol O-acyltransferase 2-like isoform X1 [Salmo salar]|eukprot:XP_014018432.1 PREDICTED: diacylglycerol O-acyltransferase 2-like isoform X1 [Salmo salar]
MFNIVVKKTILPAYTCVLRGTGCILSALQSLLSVRWAWCPRLENQVQIFSVMQFIVSFLIIGPICSVVMLYLLWTDYWWVTASYTTWLVYDWNTHKQAGRRFSWVRNWTVWTYYRDYFPVRLIKTHNLLPNRNYILGYHPHGIFCFGAFCNFATEANGFSAKFPGITPFVATLAGNFHMPLVREYLMSAGICPVNRATLEFILSCNGTGNAVVITVGGAAESLDCTPGVHCVTLKNRKGFVKLALQQGADLVPVYSFGENDVYKQLILNEGSWWRLIQRRLQKILGFAPCVFQGRGLFSPDTWGLVPFSKPINSVVGKPMEMPKISSPSQEEVNHYHTMYVSSLTQLFDKHKTHFGLRDGDVLVIH